MFMDSTSPKFRGILYNAITKICSIVEWIDKLAYQWVYSLEHLSSDEHIKD
jgi:hypothetical protein